MSTPVRLRSPPLVFNITEMSLVPVDALDGIVKLPVSVVWLGLDTPERLIPPTVAVGVPGASAGGRGG